MSSDNEVDRSSIAVLCPSEVGCDVVLSILNSKGVRAERLSKRMLSGKRRNCVVIATIDEFKGLERPVVCVAGLAAPEDTKLFSLRAYLAFSRANHTLTFVCEEREAQTIIELEKARLLSQKSEGGSNAGQR